ncbi:glycoside hydrolase family 3 protein [Anaerobium acetethylicum]|uniref:Beta-glucosidase n=1 Tax=Anaerobium acetethylicum TaxID=1619234 RepID=A0A1D3TW56_9FIRM|nr:glycoside hydrolase family 3 protein [Anaerobium acetethylicum]SCP98434.1 beta-glucosidase [Anaerobium acetethylicum]
MKNKTNVWRGLTASIAVLLSVSIFTSALLFSWSGQVNVFLNVTPPTMKADDSTMYYESDYGLSDEGLAAMIKDSDAHDVQTMEEGAVLLKNDNAALPLASSERGVTLFGRAVADPVYQGNSGGPSRDPDRQVSLYSALESAGFKINDTLFDAYANSTVKRAKAEPDWFIGEVDKDFYTDELKASYENDFNDIAIVMLSRDGGEGKDLATTDRDGISFLALHDTEKDLLKMIKESDRFTKTIVLINSAYAMELGWLAEEEYGVDAALWIGDPALKGFEGVANVLTGEADPSGRFVDTYAANSLSAPAVRNAGSFTYANKPENYIVEAEGIYVGYKYYETRYQDSIFGINNADGTAGVYAGEGTGWNYADEMVYPFGYGMSYADFSQELKEVTWDRTEHTVTAVVNVTNEGYPENTNYEGKSKSVVELYAQLPYETGQAEKAAVQLAGFEKTDALAAGESQEVTITVDDYLFATYDANAENGADTTKKGCYVFDAGDYFFAIGDDSHDALNNILAAREGGNVSGRLVNADGTVVEGDAGKTVGITLDTTDNTTYAKSQYTNEIVCNQFEDIDLNHFTPDTVTYLTRDDWNTYPVSYTDITATDEMMAQLEGTEYVQPTDAPAYTSFKQGEDVTLKLIDMKDVPFDDDEKWSQFLDQLTVGELCSTIGENFGQPAVSSIDKPVNTNTDGPGGSQSAYRYGNKAPATLHISEIVAASAWNQDLIAERGSFIAEDCLFSGTNQLWSPGANLHRTPFSGRNFEYYSEDSILSYIMSAAQTKAMQDKGLNASIKHFCANDQETNRDGLSIFMTEQNYRQGALKGFEGAFTEGGALATMLSCSRIGNRLMYEDEATLTQVLRNEWGFQGVTITDSVKGASEVPTIESLIAGSDTFNADKGRASEVQKYLVAHKDGYVLENLRDANRRFYYAMANSSLINGLSAETEVSGFTPWWQYALIGINGILGVGLIATAALFVRGGYRKRKKGAGLDGIFEK